MMRKHVYQYTTMVYSEKELTPLSVQRIGEKMADFGLASLQVAKINAQVVALGAEKLAIAKEMRT